MDQLIEPAAVGRFLRRLAAMFERELNIQVTSVVHNDYIGLHKATFSVEWKWDDTMIAPKLPDYDPTIR